MENKVFSFVDKNCLQKWTQFFPHKYSDNLPRSPCHHPSGENYPDSHDVSLYWTLNYIRCDRLIKCWCPCSAIFSYLSPVASLITHQMRCSVCALGFIHGFINSFTAAFHTLLFCTAAVAEDAVFATRPESSSMLWRVTAKCQSDWK